MRETCARVLAAALMTGAIAAALAMPALFDSARDVGHGLTAPPSSLERLVRVPALSVQPQRARARGPATVHRVHELVGIARVAPEVKGTSEARAARTKPHATGHATVKPPPTATRELTSTTPTEPAPPPAEPAPAAPAPSEPDVSACNGKSNGKGKANGHCKQAAPTPPPPAAPTQAPPATVPSPPAQPDDAADESKDHGHGNGNGQDKDHGERAD